MSVLGLALALSTSQCPQNIAFEIRVDKVHASSIYNKVEGWAEARSRLLGFEGVNAELKLVSKDDKSCTYRNDQKMKAVLSSTTFYDPEFLDAKTIRLTLGFMIQDSNYLSFIPVKSYNENGILTYGSPSRQKLKTRLFIKETQKYVNIDLGMGTVILR